MHHQVEIELSLMQKSAVGIITAVEKICHELKDKAPADLSVLVLSLSTIIKMMITTF